MQQFRHTAANCRLRQVIQEEEKTEDIRGIALYAQKEESIGYIDGGCTKHMTGDKEKFPTLKKKKGGDVALVRMVQQKFLARELQLSKKMPKLNRYCMFMA